MKAIVGALVGPEVVSTFGSDSVSGVSGVEKIGFEKIQHVLNIFTIS